MKSQVAIIIAFTSILFSCSNKTETIPNKNSELIEITKAQFDSEKMKIGIPSLHPFADLVYFTGKVAPSINGEAKISVSISGKISKIHIKPGQIIKKGSILFEISGNELIDIQKDFAESSAMLKIVKSDYERAKQLHADNITTQKEYVKAESNFLAENAKYNALKLKLTIMNLNVSKIEKGEYFTTYPLISPFSGFVADLNASIGQFVEPQQEIAIIANAQSLHLHFSIFEKDIHKIKTKQLVEFYLNGNSNKKYNAEIISIGQYIKNDSKSIDCCAEINNLKNLNIISNQFAEGNIFSTIDSAMAIPQTAIINSENESYVLVLKNKDDSNYYFQKEKIDKGRSSKNYIEIKEQLSSNELLVEGGYNVQIE